MWDLKHRKISKTYLNIDNTRIRNIIYYNLRINIPVHCIITVTIIMKQERKLKY